VSFQNEQVINGPANTTTFTESGQPLSTVVVTWWVARLVALAVFEGVRLLGLLDWDAAQNGMIMALLLLHRALAAGCILLMVAPALRPSTAGNAASALRFCWDQVATLRAEANGLLRELLSSLCSPVAAWRRRIIREWEK
jgi:hypothetical protein